MAYVKNPEYRIVFKPGSGCPFYIECLRGKRTIWPWSKDDWRAVSFHDTREKAEVAKALYESVTDLTVEV